MTEFLESDVQAIWLTLKLAGMTTVLLVILATPIAWWLSHSSSWYKNVAGALLSLPLVLPPTVLGFYLLVLMGPSGIIGKFTSYFHLPSLPFTFYGLLAGSVIFSLPFAIQPVQNAFAAIGSRNLEAAATLRAGYIDTFFSIVLPLAKPGYLTAIILTFAHTVGEFGVVLMIGGNIPGETQVLSISIYNHVEALEYGAAHLLSAAMVVFSFVLLYVLNMAGRKKSINLYE